MNYKELSYSLQRRLLSYYDYRNKKGFERNKIIINHVSPYLQKVQWCFKTIHKEYTKVYFYENVFILIDIRDSFHKKNFTKMIKMMHYKIVLKLYVTLMKFLLEYNFQNLFCKFKIFLEFLFYNFLKNFSNFFVRIRTFVEVMIIESLHLF